MLTENWLYLAVGGVISGLLAGLLGIGGGILLVPLLRTLGYNYPHAVATSSLAIVLTSTSGSVQNWRMGYLKFSRVILLGLPAIFTTLIGTEIVAKSPEYILQLSFAILTFLNIYLTNLRQELVEKSKDDFIFIKINPLIARIITGSLAGFFAGLFGVGGGLILVPFQMLFLGEKIKLAIQTSLGVIVLTSIFACFGHYYRGNILFLDGVIVGLGGLIGAQISTRFLPKIPDKYVRLSFYSLLIILGIYSFVLAWYSFYNS
jgi:uncharacterized membrane protein YfcA